VLDVLFEEQIAFDGIIGVSAGAVHGASYVAKQPGRSIRFYKKYAADPRFMSFQSLIKTGNIVGEEFCYHEWVDKLDPLDCDTFNQSDTEFYAVASNVDTGKAEYIRVSKLPEQMDAIRASASLPYVSQIVDYEGMRLLDGGICDSIPIRAFRQMGYQKNVVVLTRHDGYKKKAQNKLMGKIGYRDNKEFQQAQQTRHIRYNQTLKDIKKYEQDGSVFVFRPTVKLATGRMAHNADQLETVYNIGRIDAKERLGELRDWLDS
jgi:predicted patatin/cPLA2 family phospholipase